jgi:hypothetical protein
LRTRRGYDRDPFMIGNGGQDDPDAAGILDLRLGQTPGLRGWLSHNRVWPPRIWIQIITKLPAGPAACPETSSSPWPRKNTSPGSSGGPNFRQMARPSVSQ